MSEKKITINFHDSSKAKAFAQKARKVPGVTYATDYCRCSGSFLVMVCGDFTPEQEEMIKSRKI